MAISRGTGLCGSGACNCAEGPNLSNRGAKILAREGDDAKPIRPGKKRFHNGPMSWMRRFAEILQCSESRLAAARGWLAQIWAMIMSPRAFRRLLKDRPLQTELRWKLRLTEALLRLAITQRANAIIPPPMTPARRRGLPSGILLPADPFGPPYVARFRLSPQLSRWAIQPPVSAPETRKPQHAAALLHRLLACQDGLERFEKLAWLEAKRKRRGGMAHSFSMALSPAPSWGGPAGRAKIGAALPPPRRRGTPDALDPRLRPRRTIDDCGGGNAAPRRISTPFHHAKDGPVTAARRRCP